MRKLAAYIHTLDLPRRIMKATLSLSSLLLVATLVVLSEGQDWTTLTSSPGVEPTRTTTTEGYNGCPDIDPLDHTVHLPHLTNCNLFYRCDHGYPKLDRCPAGLHFNPKLQVCDWPKQAGCTAGRDPLPTTTISAITTTQPSPVKNCTALPGREIGAWAPDSCNRATFWLNDMCILMCPDGFEITGGKDVRCSKDGWMGWSGLNQMPECKAVADMGGEFVDRINRTLEGRPANMIFLLDESYSLYADEFALEVQFMKALVRAFPLGYNRAAGAITFSSRSMVDITVSTDDTCSFLAQAELIRYEGGGTDILGALRLAIAEVMANSVHNFTLVFLITDGVSYSDPQSAADLIKSSGNVIFTVGVGQFDTNQLISLASKDENGVPIFFPIDNFAVFQKVAEYLENAYNTGDQHCNFSTSSTTSSTPAKWDDMSTWLAQ